MKDTYCDGIDMLTFELGQGHALEEEAILRIHPALAADYDFNLEGQENTISFQFLHTFTGVLDADAKGETYQRLQ